MLSRESPTPLYAQVKQRLLQQIDTGVLRPGERLPSESELEKTFQVSRITIRRALGDLAAAGYLRRQPGSGTVVTQSRIRHDSGKVGGFHDDLVAQGFEVDSLLLSYAMGPIDPETAERTGIGRSAHVLAVRKLIRANGVPVVLLNGHHVLPGGVHLSAEDVQVDSIFTVLRRRFGREPRRAERTIEAGLPDDEEAELLAIPKGTPVLLIELVAYDEAGAIMANVRSVYRSDRYKYVHSVSV
jgi:GntR family transcriptional regulator